MAETIEFLIELSGTRVESHRLTHGVVMADVLDRAPQLQVSVEGDITIFRGGEAVTTVLG
jgi:hypothetical protein